MKSYDIRFPIITISLAILFSGLINYTYGQVNDTSQTYENRDIGIRFQYPSEWGKIGEVGDCHNQVISCSISSLVDNNKSVFVLDKYSKESANSLMDMVKSHYTIQSQSPIIDDFSFINDNRTVVGKNHSGWQYEYSFVKDGVNKKRTYCLCRD